MTFSPSSDRVLVRVDEESNKTPGGLFKPEIASRSTKPRTATVVSVGPGRWIDGVLVEVPFYPGNRVMLDYVGGLDIELDGVKHVLCRAEEVLGRFEEKVDVPYDPNDIPF